MLARTIKLTGMVWACAGIVIIGAVQAESVYIKDTLRVGVRPEPSNNAASIGIVVTGMKVEVIERRANHLLIKTDKGLQGWIKASYVSDTPPAKLKLASLQRDYQKLQERLKQDDSSTEKVQLTIARLRQEIDTLKKSNAELQMALTNNQRNTSTASSTSFWEISTYVLLSLLGFAIGVIWYRHQAMKRLGGLRV